MQCYAGTREFQRAPTLGGECYSAWTIDPKTRYCCFNGHPPLGVNATGVMSGNIIVFINPAFQRAPTLGGECYNAIRNTSRAVTTAAFQRAPTLGGECYTCVLRVRQRSTRCRFNGHPPLGVNATDVEWLDNKPFLMGVSTGTHPWG